MKTIEIAKIIEEHRNTLSSSEIAYIIKRAIKFRAWDTFHKEMVYQDRTLTAGKILERYSEIMQYTDAKDKHGKEIYEGDILHWNTVVCLSMKHGEIREDIYAKVIWTEKGAGFTLERIGTNPLHTLDFETAEIIGNIFENPELVAK